MLSMLPTDLAIADYGLPGICARHGKAATVRRRFKVSTPVGAGYLLLLLGVLPFVIYRQITRKSVTVAPWPFCADCLARRRNILILWSAIAALTAAGLGVNVAVSAKPGIVVLGIGLLGLIAFVAVRTAGWANLARATYTENQLFVQVEAAPEFAALLASSPEVAAVTASVAPAQQPPLQWFKPLKPVWFIALVIGALALIGGVMQLAQGGPSCGTDTMRQGDVCVTEGGSGRESVETYDEEVTKMYVVLAVGVMLTVVGGAVTAANKIGNRRRYAAFVAAQNS